MEYKITNKLTQEVIDEIIKVKEKKGLTAEALVEQAKDKKNPLHTFFEWDNKQAGEKWRLQQARVIINEVKVIVEHKELYAFENISVKIEGKSEPSKKYYSRDEILNNEVLKETMVQKAYKQLQYWKTQYESYNVFSDIVEAINNLDKKEIDIQETQNNKIEV